MPPSPTRFGDRAKNKAAGFSTENPAPPIRSDAWFSSNHARSDWSLQAYWDQRDYAAGGQDGVTFTEGETYSGVRAATRWQAFSRTRVDVDAWWEKRKLAQGDLGQLELTIALVRNLTPQIEARLAATWSEQNANTATLPEFKAGTAFLGVVWRR